MNTAKVKIPAAFVIFAAVIIAAAAAIHSICAVTNYCEAFQSSVNAFFTEDFTAQLDTVESGINVNNAEGVIIVEETASSRSDALRALIAERLVTHPLPSQCGIYILSALDNHIITTVRGELAEIEQTESIANAGTDGKNFDFSYLGKCLEYADAVPSNAAAEYIVYVYDSRDTLNDEIASIVSIYVKLLIAALILAFIVGLVIARSVKKPYDILNERAAQLVDKNPPSAASLTLGTDADELAETFYNVATTLRKSATNAEHERRKLEAMLENIHDGILAFDDSGKLTHINKAATKLLRRNYLNDISFDRYFKEIDADITLGDVLYGKDGGEMLERSVVMDGKYYLQLDFTTFETDKKSRGIIVLIHDITKHRMLEESRRNFVADVSHELRTPLTTVKSYAETLIDMPDADIGLITRFLSVIASETDRMTRIVSDLLILSRLDAKQTQFVPPVEIDVRRELNAIADRLSLDARKKGLTLRYTPINDVKTVLGDRDAFEQVIVNILSNAIKYTPEGGSVDMYSSLMFDDVCIKIKDTGIGIPEEHLPHIFDRFYRVDKARSRDKGGTGLGLAIAKQTLETVFHGKIEITSTVGKGTEVIITIPQYKHA